MKKNSNAKDNRSLWLSLIVLGLTAGLFILPYQFNSLAGSKKTKGIFTRTESHEENLKNYDIREERDESAADSLAKFRQSAGKDAVTVANVRENFVRGEQALKQRIPTLKVEYNTDIRIPEVITPDVWKANVEFLTPASNIKRAEILRNFAKENDQLVGVSNSQADALRVTADYTNPDGNLSFAHLEQRINNVPVFRGEIKAGFTRQGEMIRVINNLAPGLDYESLSTDFRNPLDAVKAAARHINYELQSTDVARNDAASTDLKVVFGEGDWATTAEKMYFPTEPGVAVPSWRVLIWQPVNAYYVIVDAESGTMLWRKNITEDQAETATYNVYRNTNAYIPAADSPAPLSPGPIDPTLGTQGVNIARANVTLIGNEAPNSFNNLGWITDGTNITDGNNVEAGIDRVAPNGVDAPQTGNPNRVFDAPTWNPPPGNPAPGDDPLLPQAQRGAVIQMFYVMNLYHDELYRLGFTEPAFNFQNDNFGRGGAGADRVSAEGQDSSGTNNANFATPADGGRGRMQMFLWTGQTPDYDGTADADVIIHEVTHGTSNRLHGNAAGLSTNMSRGMGEGWGDFYGHSMLSEPTDPINGIYSTGGYATYLIAAGFTGNYYYGIRRFPKAVIAFTGPNGKPHNPLTFKYVNADCNTLIGTPTSNPPPNSAFPRGPIGVAQCDQVHNLGEIWSSALWEVRSLMVTRLGHNTGTRRTLQFVTDGMKLAPIGPTFLQERDAIIAGAVASGTSADVTDIREGFRRRGMGFSASIQSPSPAAVTEAFDFPNVVMTNPFSVSDSTGDNDGFPEPGENVLLSVAVTNQTGGTVNNVQVNVNGGPNVNYGNINDGQTVTMQIPYTVPASAPCGSLHQVTINVSSAVGAQLPQTRTFRLGAPVGGPPVSFSNTTAITIPSSGPGSVYPSTINVSGVTGMKAIKVELTDISHVFPGDVDFLLEGPNGQNLIILSDAGGTNDWVTDDITLTDLAANIASDTGAIPTGQYKPTNYGANDPFVAPAPAGPYGNPAPAGTDTFESKFGTNGANLNGTWKLYVVDDLAGFAGTIAGGWKITFESAEYNCTIIEPSSARADFDGDGRTDLSVFRPSEGNWYLSQSTAGFGVISWGSSSDVLVPGDYDNDGKADTAIFRATADSSQPDFYILNSNGFTISGVSWGIAGDIPVNRDYDGDGKTDVGVFRPSDNVWYILRSGGGTSITHFGQGGDVPIPGDFEGDGRGDLTVYRSGTWISQLSSGGMISFPLGTTGDILVPADYDGDDEDDFAVFRPGTGEWYVRNSSIPAPNPGAVTITVWGTAGDVPVPGDYDGDGKDDLAIYRNGQWWLLRSTAGVATFNFGVATDRPVPDGYIP